MGYEFPEFAKQANAQGQIPASDTALSQALCFYKHLESVGRLDVFNDEVESTDFFKERKRILMSLMSHSTNPETLNLYQDKLELAGVVLVAESIIKDIYELQKAGVIKSFNPVPPTATRTI